MNNITLDTTNFSEQLGIYDFFNVIISGAVFVFGSCVISERIYKFILADPTVVKGLAIVLAVYISGLVLQELGSLVDRYLTRVKRRERSRFLFDIREPFFDRVKEWFSKAFSRQIDTEKRELEEHKNDTIKSDAIEDGKNKKKMWNCVIENKLVLDNYRNLADRIYKDNFPNKTLDDGRFNDEDFNSFVFTTIQYYVSCAGKEKKAEKLRALFDMSRSLMVCFALFALSTLLSLVMPDFVPSALELRCSSLLKVVWIVSTLLSILFLLRMIKTKKYMILIMLGSCDAYLRTLEEGSSTEKETTTKVRVRVTNVIKDRR